MYPRNLEPALLEALSDSPAVFLNGARQTGKSTMVQGIAKASRPARYPARFANDMSLCLLLLSLFAFALATLGVLGVMNYWVSEQRRDTGIRMAMGATPGEVMRSVLRQGVFKIAVGVAAGWVLALAVTRTLGSYLHDVNPFDPLTYVGVTALMVLVAFLACYIPARRATRIDPMEALRYE